jgi:DNA-binding NarL/FixJ family response regulator
LFGEKLTPRQREVLQLVAEGKSNKEIATILNVSLKTVDFHKARLMDELGLRTTAELTRYALRHGIVGQ